MKPTKISTIPAFNNLPANFLIDLSHVSAISLSGEDKVKYLQGQVTCDVVKAAEQSVTCGAHCEAKGKVLSVFRLVHRDSNPHLIQPKTSIEKSLAELKKFGVFAKVKIKQEASLGFYALVGCEAEKLLQASFSCLPDSFTPVVQANSTTIVYIAGEQVRYLLIDEQANLDNVVSTFNLPVYEQAIWDMLEIKEGFPILSSAAIGEFVPQMLNLQAIHGISFTKGCYLGQETVARMQYLGRNKRALYSLSNTALSQDMANFSVQAGDIIEQQLGEYWRKAGDVLAAVTSSEPGHQSLYLQAVLSNDLEQNTVLRLKDFPNVQLSLENLPYKLN